MSSLYNVNAPKKPTNLTINTDLLNQAKVMNINISSILETALANVVKQKKREKWLEENIDAINSYNEYVSQAGLFSDELRTF
jgi:antitoxin CcdA